VFDRCYDHGPYRQRLRYQDPVPPPPLPPEQAGWVGRVLREKGLLPTAARRRPPRQARPKRRGKSDGAR
jgi:hypothetical protein